MLVRDLDASVSFYRDVLGFRLVLHDAKTHAWALLRRGDAEVFLEDRAAWPQEAVPLCEHGPLTLHLALAEADETVLVDPDGVQVVVTNLRRRAA